MTSRHTPVFRRATFAGLLFLVAQNTLAERLFVGILEADSYQSILYGASAFSRMADLPLALELVQNTLSKKLSLPSFTGIAASEMLRIVQTIDPALPLGADNPATVALIPLADNGEASREAFAAAYKTRTVLDPVTLYENPSDTNLTPRVAVAVSERHLLTSTSRDALDWAWRNRAKFIEAPTQSIPGTVRILVNPQRFADLLGSRSEKAADLLNVGSLIRDFDSLSFALTLDGQALSFTVRGAPKKDTGLEALAASWRKPSDKLWNGVPDTAFFMWLTACDKPELWDAYLGKTRSRLLHPVVDLAPQTAFTGERLFYLAPNKDKSGLCFVQIEPVTNAAPVREAIQNLHTAEQEGNILLTRRPQRSTAGTPVETYAITLQPPAVSDGKKAEPSVLFTVLSLFLKRAVLETAVTDGHLISVIGTEHSIEGELQALAFSEKPLNLHRKISGQYSALNEKLNAGATLHVARLVRHVVSIMPGVKPEQVRLLPTGGDGATLGISLKDQTLTASLRIQSNEIAALQRINRDGRDVLQELFFQMFAKQMMGPQVPSEKQ